jgi:hypothetical protein
MSGNTREHARLREARDRNVPWKQWGPYLSERQWGTVRENVTLDREAWDDVTHDKARSHAYRSGEDGIAGFCDDNMLLCFALALWNGRDAILKERLFGLTNSEGNHGEDVKEYYFYLDSTPTHSYARMLYKYPQAAYPYTDLVAENRRRSRYEFEYELLDTGIFEGDRYWDVFVEYAKAAPEDILVRITVVNRGPDAAPIHVLPHLWFRNTWWMGGESNRPALAAQDRNGVAVVEARHERLGTWQLSCDGAGELLFTDNETNRARLSGQPNASPYVKDGINEYVVHGKREAVNPDRNGTKAAAHYQLTVPPGESRTIRLRLTRIDRYPVGTPFGSAFEAVVEERRREADAFYKDLLPASLSEDAAQVVRQGYAGLLWTKQAYVYDVDHWLRLRGVPHNAAGDGTRNQQWFHMYSADVISMPDKWEYPWFAAWDLAFHAVSLAMVDPDFAAGQMDLMLRERYQHPNGQLPAYEWNFGDVNPPVHAWATLFNYRLNRESLGDDALPFLKRVFHKLLSNFTWWTNRKDRDGNNVFQGGFLGLDNIGVFDRSAPLPTGGYLEQADGTAWMAFFAQNMLDMALELALADPTYEELAIKFYEHFIWIAAAMNDPGHDTMWDDADGFYYDVLRVPGQWTTRIKVRSMVGLLPICAATVYRPETLERLPNFVERVRWFNERRPDLLVNFNEPTEPGVGGRHLLSLLSEEKLRRVLARMLDPAEFLGDHGIRSLSRVHLEHPYVFYAGNQEYRVSYLPAESNTGMFGGNSNWRGPIWAPVNALLVRAMLHLYSYYGDGFRIECPTGSGQYMNLYEVGREIANRMAAIFLRDHQGRRPVYGGLGKFQEDPHWRDYLLFYEYFHGDNGAGLGASHQTGWTAMIVSLMHLFASVTPDMILAPERLMTQLDSRRFPEARSDARPPSRSR